MFVVIAIIGLLASVVLVSLNRARVKARDAKRIADLSQIQKAAELYYNTYNQYPVDGGYYDTSRGIGDPTNFPNNGDWQKPGFADMVPEFLSTKLLPVANKKTLNFLVQSFFIGVVIILSPQPSCQISSDV